MSPWQSGRDKIQQDPVFTCKWEGQNIPHCILRTAKLHRAYHTHTCYASEISIVEGPRSERKVDRPWVVFFSSVAEGRMLEPGLRLVVGVL
jgi:hypothetical protein